MIQRVIAYFIGTGFCISASWKNTIRCYVVRYYWVKLCGNMDVWFKIERTAKKYFLLFLQCSCCSCSFFAVLFPAHPHRDSRRISLKKLPKTAVSISATIMASPIHSAMSAKRAGSCPKRRISRIKRWQRLCQSGRASELLFSKDRLQFPGNTIPINQPFFCGTKFFDVESILMIIAFSSFFEENLLSVALRRHIIRNP